MESYLYLQSKIILGAVFESRMLCCFIAKWFYIFATLANCTQMGINKS